MQNRLTGGSVALDQSLLVERRVITACGHVLVEVMENRLMKHDDARSLQGKPERELMMGVVGDVVDDRRKGRRGSWQLSSLPQWQTVVRPLDEQRMSVVDEDLD